MIDLFVFREICPVCGSNDINKVYQEQYSSKNLIDFLLSAYIDRGGANPSLIQDSSYTLCECENCCLVFQKNIPNKQFMNIIYSEWINAEKLFYKVRKRKLNYYRYLRRNIESMILHLDKNPSQIKVYDFGMGWGDFAMMCQAFGCDVVGTELSQEKAEYSNRFGVKNIPLDKLGEYQFDIINANQVFEHIDKPVEYLKKISTLLKQKGIIRITVPNGDGFIKSFHGSHSKKEYLYNNFKLVAPLEHVNLFTTSSIKIMGSFAGLVPVDIKKRQYIKDYTLSEFKKWVCEPLIGSRHSSSIEIYFQHA